MASSRKKVSAVKHKTAKKAAKKAATKDKPSGVRGFPPPPIKGKKK